ncbi:MAG: hypothetical protein E7587_01550 [Ruminococcaceae bacterium]|nr:hypothetical protein [Oscillospiraceae bacterium]
MIIIYMLFLALLFFIQYKVAKMFEAIAFDKGYDKKAHPFALCFWLGIIGYIYVAAMPKLTATDIQERTYRNAEETYRRAVKIMKEGDEYNSAEVYKDAIKLFNTITNHKDTNELIAYCERKIQELK